MNTGTTEPAPPARRWARRIGWLVLIWLASVLAMAAVAGGLKLAMQWAGLSTPP